MGEEKPQKKSREEVIAIGKANLRPNTMLSDEEKHNLAVMGGKARAKQRRELRSMKETLSLLLNDNRLAVDIAKANGNPLLIQATEQGATVNDLLMLSATLQGMEGNVKALEFIRDTNGQRPKDQIDIQADVITASDRALIDKLKRNIGQNDEESEG